MNPNQNVPPFVRLVDPEQLSANATPYRNSGGGTPATPTRQASILFYTTAARVVVGGRANQIAVAPNEALKFAVAPSLSAKKAAPNVKCRVCGLVCNEGGMARHKCANTPKKRDAPHTSLDCAKCGRHFDNSGA